MVAIAPFRALRYAGKDLADVTSPPHDVITDEERDAFLEKDPDNICSLILPPGEADDAATRLQEMVDGGILVRDDTPAFYMVEMSYYEPGQGAQPTDSTGPDKPPRRRMRGFFARIAVDPDYKEIRRHEKTLPKKRSIRLDLLRATQTNTEPIWMLYRDERGWVDELLQSNALDELERFTDEEGTEHRLWRVDRPEAVGEIIAQFDDRTLVIADGHHRYATQCKRYAETGRDEDGSILVCLVRDTDEGVDILPTDRLVVDLPFPDVQAAIEAAEAWDATPVDLPDDDAETARVLRQAIGGDARTCAVLGHDGAWLLTLKSDVGLDKGRGTLDRLAVTIVHDQLLARSWGVDLEQVEDHLRFTRSDLEAVQAVRSGQVPAAVLLSPEPVAAVLDVASEGHVMPQKSTYFIPKLRSGLVMSPCDEPLPVKWTEQVDDPGKMDFRLPKM